MFSILRLRQFAAAGLGLMLVSLVSVGVHAQDAKLKAGTLTCKGKGTVGFVLGSKESLECNFAPIGSGPTHYYDGTITRVGIDIGVRGGSIMVWTVLGSTTELPYESLGGSFSGVSADVSAGLGVGANVLVGGNSKSIVLQPISVKGETGISLAAGVAGLNLVPLR